MSQHTIAPPGSARIRWSHRTLGILRLTHPFPAGLVVITSAFLVLVAHHGNPGLPRLLRVVGVITLSQIAVGALNEYVDRDRDAAVQQEKPIPSGLVAPRFAVILTACSVALLVLVALPLGPAAFGLALAGTSAGLAYDLWLKPTLWSAAPYVIGFLALVLFVWVAVGDVTSRLVPLCGIGVLLLVAAHLAQSYPDVETDRELGLGGLSVVLGPGRISASIFGLYGLAAGTALVLSLRSFSQLGLVGLSAVCAAAAFRRSGRAKRQRAARIDLFRLMTVAIAFLALAILLWATSSG